jgi:phage tail sheath protein FI
MPIRYVIDEIGKQTVAINGDIVIIGSEDNGEGGTELSFKHGVYISETSAAVLPVREISAGIPYVVGLAPIHRSQSAYSDVVLKPKLITSYQEYLEVFGEAGGSEQDKYTLQEFAYVFFQLYGVSPAVFVNVFDPITHGTAVTGQSVTLVDGECTIYDDADLSTLVVKDSAGTTTYVIDVDYTAEYINTRIVIKRIDGGAITSETASLKLDYTKIDDEPCDETDIGNGLNKIEDVYPLHSVVPGMILAPGFSQIPAVKTLMVSKTENINGLFNAIAIADIDSASATGAETYSEVAEWIATNGYIDEHLIIGWPKVVVANMTPLSSGITTYWMSSHIAGMLASIDADNDDVPYVSPSNKPMRINGLVNADGDDVILTALQANVLNSVGVTTALNFNGWRLWGNYTSNATTTDPKDLFACVRRMFDWTGNNAVLLLWEKLDQPINRRTVETAVDSLNQWLNGLISKGAFNDARCEFLQTENSNEDLALGIMRLHLYLTPPSPAQEIDVTLEYNAAGNTAVFA